MKQVLFSAVAFGALMVGGAAQAACGDVTLAVYSWQSAEAMSNVDQFILKNGYGCNATTVAGDTVPTITAMIEKGQPVISPESTPRGIENGKSREIGMRWIDRVGLLGFESRFPDELSGGMQQRVGLARALSNNASILLMDEAYSALDPLIRTDMRTMLLDLQAELGKTIVFITHDLDEALRLGDRIVILRDGSIIQQGNSEDILLNPADDYIERFVRDVNRGRFMRVDAVMDPALGSEDRSLPELKSGSTLEIAAKQLTSSSYDTAVVTGDSGQPLGMISLRQITAALSSAVEKRSVAPV